MFCLQFFCLLQSTILVVISIFSITVLAAPTEEKVEPASIVNYESEPVGADGTYSFRYNFYFIFIFFLY